MEKFELLTKEVQEKFGVSIKYCLITCDCGHSWGKSFYGETPVLELKDLVCQKCAMTHVIDNYSK